MFYPWVTFAALSFPSLWLEHSFPNYILYSGKEHTLWSHPSSLVYDLGKFLSLHMPQFPHLKHGANSAYIMRW